MKTILLLILTTACAALSAVEYFVSGTNGNDTNSGLTRAQAFKTIAYGAKQLKPGDTLTVLPGRYYEAVILKFAGDKDKTTVMRAEFPGSVLIHGDKPVGNFQPVPGRRFVHVTDWRENVNAVNERDTLNVYLPAGSVSELEFNRNLWFHDKTKGKLYISTSDGKAPSEHELSVSVLNGHGILIGPSTENFIIDGFVVTGFYSHFRLYNDMSQGRHGIYGMPKHRFIIRNCTAFLNSNGITMGGRGRESVIENCVAYANGSQAASSGGNIVGQGATSNVIRNCRSFFAANKNGIRFYGPVRNCRIENCVSFGERGTNIKGIPVIDSPILNCYSDEGIAAAQSRNCVYNSVNSYNREDPESLSLIRLPKKKFDYDRLFADPDNYDFRPQAGAQGIEKGLLPDENLRFLSPSGDDAKSGKNLAEAWKTFAKIGKNASVLLVSGNYPKADIDVSGVKLSTRGTGKRAVIAGGRFIGNDLTIDNVDFSGPVFINGDNIKISNCTFHAGVTGEGRRLALIHNRFLQEAAFRNSTGFAHSNIGTVSGVSVIPGDRSLDAMPMGPYRLVHRAETPVVTGPFVRSVTDTTANIEWWYDRNDVTGELVWGENEKCANKAGQPYSGTYYNTITLTGLQPGKKYFFRIAARSPLREHHTSEELDLADRKKPRRSITSDTQSFSTLSQAPASRNLYVKAGAAGNGGMNTPCGTIGEALDQAVAGDTVWIGGGKYRETLYFRAGGDRNKPLTLRSMPGEHVEIDGGEIMTHAMMINQKKHLILDGIYFREIVDGKDHIGVININGGGDILIRRCFYDGRNLDGYPARFIQANSVRNLTLENSVILSGNIGGQFMRCPGLLIRNCVWAMNQIQHMYVHNLPKEPFMLRNNIFTDIVPTKYRNALIDFWHLESLREQDNCFFLLQKPEWRRLFSWYRVNNQARPQNVPYDGLIKAAHSAPSALFVNPGMRGIKVLPQFQKNPLTQETKSSRAPEAAEMEKQHLKQSILAYPSRGLPAKWDFDDFFASEPECIKRNIGLERAVFQNDMSGLP